MQGNHCSVETVSLALDVICKPHRHRFQTVGDEASRVCRANGNICIFLISHFVLDSWKTPDAVEMFVAIVSLCLDKHMELGSYKSWSDTHKIRAEFSATELVFRTACSFTELSFIAAFWDCGLFKFKCLRLGHWKLSFLLPLSSYVVLNARSEL